MGITKITPFIVCFVLMASCSSDPLDVDVSNVKVEDVKIRRFDKDFFQMDSSAIEASVEKLRNEYGLFTDAFVNNIVCASTPDSIGCNLAIRDYLSNHITRGAWEDACKKLGDDYSAEEKEINGAYQHFRYYFPDRQLPKGVFLAMTGFNYNFLHSEGYYAIGMEFFLGKDDLYYDALQWPIYKRRTLQRNYIASGFVRSWMMNEFPYTSERNDVINRIVYEGKILYLQKALLRDTPDSVITGFSEAQLNWCVTNEAEMWAKMIEDKIVYSESEDDLNHMTQDAPFTPGFPRESPGKAGCWLGMRIVESFMEKNPKTTLAQLMEMNDGQIFLTKSKYKPKF